MRALAVACVAAVALAGAAWAVTRDGRAVTYDTCVADDAWAREQVIAMLDGARPQPYEPYDGRSVVEAFRRAGFPLPAENQLKALGHALAVPDMCDFRWFAETNPFDPAQPGPGQLRVMVTSTPFAAAFEFKERRRLARKYGYAHTVEVLMKGNVVVEYYVELPDGTPVRPNRLAVVNAVLATL